MSKAQKRRRTLLPNGRDDRQESYVKLDFKFIDDPRFKALSPAATRALIILMRRYYGHNNGRIAMPVRAGDPWGVKKDAMSRALRELVGRGFIEVVTASAFTLKTKRAAEYRLRWLPVLDDERRPVIRPDFYGSPQLDSKQNTVAASRQIGSPGSLRTDIASTQARH